MTEFSVKVQERHAMPARRAPCRPSLSVIVLSSAGRSELEEAMSAIAGRCRSMDAEIIVVRSTPLHDAAGLRAAYPCVKFVDGATATNDAEMRDLGMQRAGGDIVAIRMDGVVGDGAWLDAFGALVGSIEPGVPASAPTRRDAEVAIVASVEGTGSDGERRRASRPVAVQTPAAPHGRWMEPERERGGVPPRELGVAASTRQREM